MSFNGRSLHRMIVHRCQILFASCLFLHPFRIWCHTKWCVCVCVCTCFVVTFQTFFLINIIISFHCEHAISTRFVIPLDAVPTTSLPLFFLHCFEFIDIFVYSFHSVHNAYTHTTDEKRYIHDWMHLSTVYSIVRRIASGISGKCVSGIETNIIL